MNLENFLLSYQHDVIVELLDSRHLSIGKSSIDTILEEYPQWKNSEVNTCYYDEVTNTPHITLRYRMAKA